MFKRYIILLSLVFAPLLLAPAGVSAVDVFERNVCDQSAANNAAVCKDKDLDGKNPLFGQEGILTKIVSLLSAIVGIVAVIVIITAGLKFVTSGSNPQDVTNARERIVYALLALIIAASAQVLVRFVLRGI